jgi:hypothetical protein
MSRLRFRIVGIALLLAGVGAGPVGAVVFVSSQIDISAEAEAQLIEPPSPLESDFDSASATDVLTFDQSVSASATSTAPGEAVSAGATSRLEATFTPTSIFVQPFLSAGKGPTGSLGIGRGEALADYEMTFTVVNARQYVFDIDFFVEHTFSGTPASVTLTDSSLATVFTRTATHFTNQTVQETGVLAPGDYTLSVAARAFSQDELFAASTVITVNGAFSDPPNTVPALPLPALLVLAAGLAGAAGTRLRS